jgi:hypothetical protein
VQASADVRTFIRHVIGATGTHVGCEHGVCGACTVQIDGAPARSCIMLAVQAEGADIRTVEGLAPPSCPVGEICQNAPQPSETQTVAMGLAIQRFFDVAPAIAAWRPIRRTSPAARMSLTLWR